MHKRLAVVLTVLLLVALPSNAHAHGADAAQALLGQDTSYPIGVPLPLRRALDGMVRQARAKGYSIKVALVQDRFDVPQPQWLYDAQAYADALTQTLGFRTPERVLTVHPVGFGGNNLGEAPANALTELDTDTSGQLDRLAIKAMRAVARLTEVAGRPVALPAVARQDPDDGGGVPVWLIVGGVVALLGGGLGLTTFLSRDQADDDAPAT